MAIYAVHLNVLTYIEADNEGEAEQRVYENPICHYINHENVVQDVDIHDIEFIVRDEEEEG